MLGGEPRLAKESAKWLGHFKENFHGLVEDEENATLLTSFSTDDIELANIHTMVDYKQAAINIAEAMEFLTQDLDRGEIRETPFVRDNWSLIEEFAADKSVVNLLDGATWLVDGKEHPLAMQIHQRVMPVHHHQQLLENYIQSLGFVSKTNVRRDLEVKSLAHHIDADSCSREDGEGGESGD